MQDEKKLIRSKMLAMRRNMSKEEVESRSLSVMKNMDKIILESKPQSILLYVPINNEVDIIPLARDLYYKKKDLVFPKIIDRQRIEPYIIRDFFRDFKKGAFNIPEPDTVPYTGHIDIAFVPGVAYDRKGNRVGYGKSFFDRFICDAKVGKIIGVCYDFQLIDSVPDEIHDCPVEQVVCESSILLTGSSRDKFLRQRPPS